jgi:hypothetical protein
MRVNRSAHSGGAGKLIAFLLLVLLVFTLARYLMSPHTLGDTCLFPRIFGKDTYGHAIICERNEKGRLIWKREVRRK